MTAATTVDYSDTGPGNADLTEQDLPEELLFKEAYADTFKVQCCNNIDSFYEYENVLFWGKIGTSDFILDVIYEEYKIPLLHEPKSVFLNNKSSYTHTNFPENAVPGLISGGLVREVSSARM